jgi:ubiquinone/menaquinone biosynthesis C-methylase UbiE
VNIYEPVGESASVNFGKPDEAVALVNYAHLADRYDEACRRIDSLRAETVALLGLRPGDRVLDVACGTGLSFRLLHEQVAPTGLVVGLELSPALASQARTRAAAIDQHGIVVIEGNAETADLGGMVFDAALFHYTHDVLRNPAALAHVFQSLRPGARIAAAGLKMGAAWALPLSLLSIYRARNYLSTFEGLTAPWSHLLRYVPDFRWRSRRAGTGYVGWGRHEAGQPFDMKLSGTAPSS